MLHRVTAPRPEPTPREVRSLLAADCRSRSLRKGLGLFLASAAVYVGSFLLAVTAASWGGRLFFAFVNGCSIAILFVIGHDAGHGSLTPVPWLNRLLGRLALLPSLHPYAAWVYTHNGLHHGWTNLRGKDFAYAPFSKAEFDALPRLRQVLERVYRSNSVGLALMYLVEHWWRHQMFPSPERRPKGKARRAFQFDRALVLLFLALQTAAACWLAPASVHSSAGRLTAAVLVAVGFPFVIWNWGIAFATFQHHTHPQVPWYDDEQEWSFFVGQVRSSVRVRLPRMVERALNHIMDHTAHHVDPRIPMYNLPRQQAALEQAYPESIAVENWSFESFYKTLRTCQLYDYENHRWMRFDGTPTTERLVPFLPPEPVND